MSLVNFDSKRKRIYILTNSDRKRRSVLAWTTAINGLVVHEEFFSSGYKNGRYTITHLPTGMVFVNSVNREDLDAVLECLTGLDWSGDFQVVMRPHYRKAGKDARQVAERLNIKRGIA